MGEHSCRNVISICKATLIEITLQHGYSPVNLLYIFKTPVSRNTFGCLLLYFNPLSASTALIQTPVNDLQSKSTDWFLYEGNMALNRLGNDSRVCKSNEGIMSAFKVFTLHAGDFDFFSFFPLKKHAARQFKQNLCSHFNTFISFPHFCVIKVEYYQILFEKKRNLKIF